MIDDHPQVARIDTVALDCISHGLCAQLSGGPVRTYEQVAEKMNMSISTVRVTELTALRKLRSDRRLRELAHACGFSI